MARQRDQIFVFTDEEFALAKAMWGENDDSLFLIRKALLQFPMTKDEQIVLKEIMTPAVWALVKKRIHPDLDPDAPLTEVGDIYQTLTPDLRAKGVQEMEPLFAAKQLELEYLDQQFEYLKDINSGLVQRIVLDDLKILKGKTAFQQYVDTTARNFLLGHVGTMLSHLKTIAGVKNETPEETKARLKRDSTK